MLRLLLFLLRLLVFPRLLRLLVAAAAAAPAAAAAAAADNPPAAGLRLPPGSGGAPGLQPAGAGWRKLRGCSRLLLRVLRVRRRLGLLLRALVRPRRGPGVNRG